jgi:hypothetical protein
MTSSASATAAAVSAVAENVPEASVSRSSVSRPGSKKGVSPLQHSDARRLLVDASDEVALRRQAHARHETNVAGSDDRNVQTHAPLPS